MIHYTSRKKEILNIRQVFAPIMKSQFKQDGPHKCVRETKVPTLQKRRQKEVRFSV